MNGPTPIPNRARLRRRVSAIAGAVAALACGTLLPIASDPTAAYASATVNGGGSSFQAPEAEQWSADVAHNPYNISINYVNSSSGAGRGFYAAGQYDYAATDVIYNAEDGTEGSTVQTTHPFRYVTVTAGGLAFEYDLVIGGVPFTSLNLSRQQVCQIFTGELTNWSQLAGTPGDGALASANLPIKPVIRSDPAGESYVLSQYCQAVDPADWAKFKNWVDANAQNIAYSDPNMAAGQPVSYWPTTLYNGDAPLAASGAPAAAADAYGANYNGNITYVATAYAVQLGAPVASVQNAAGHFVQPDANSVQLALAYARANSVGTFNLDFSGSNPGAYFPSTYSYVVDPATTHTPDGAINAPLNQYLCYAVGLGQWKAAPLRYAPLSQQVNALSVAAIEQTPDAPPASQCGKGGPQPKVSTGPGGKVTIVGTNGNPGATGTPQSNSGNTGTTNTGTTGTTVAGAYVTETKNGHKVRVFKPGSGPTGLCTTNQPVETTTTKASATTTTKPSVATTTGKKASGVKPTTTTEPTTTTTEPCPTSQSGVTTTTIGLVASQESPGGSPSANQALWWVLAGIVIAAGAVGLAGRAQGR